MSDITKPKYLKLWKRPANYIGAEWKGYYVFLGRHRDSSALGRANFDAALKAIGGELTRDDGTEMVCVVNENHWTVGCFEWIAIHESAADALTKADAIMAKLEDYPVVDEDLFSQYEETEAQEIWANCYNAGERVNYIRAHRSQFEFRDFADLRGCVRGEYFAGYASELIAR